MRLLQFELMNVEIRVIAPNKRRLHSRSQIIEWEQTKRKRQDEEAWNESWSKARTGHDVQCTTYTVEKGKKKTTYKLNANLSRSFFGVNIISSPIYSNGVTKLQFQFSARNVEMKNCRCQRAFESLSFKEFHALLVVVQLTHFYSARSYFNSPMATPPFSVEKRQMDASHHPHYIIFLEKIKSTNLSKFGIFNSTFPTKNLR